MSRTVIFGVKSTIGFCHVEVVDDTILEKDLIKSALEKIEDNGVDEPSRGIHFHENDEATENDYNCITINRD